MWQMIAKGILKMCGWTAAGTPPTMDKAVLIAAPHTSNWDGLWGLVYKVSIGIDAHFFAKSSLFWFPLGVLLRGLGGIPLDRSEPGSALKKAVDAFEANDKFYFALAPEGTRSLRTHWKTGFYRIAEAAAVPVCLGFFDYPNKRIGFGPTIELSGNTKADLARIQAFYATVEGRWPEKTSPVAFPGDR
jgi:1-acyl-sn-glycerol-3-phosphate acyltransferase